MTEIRTVIALRGNRALLGLKYGTRRLLEMANILCTLIGAMSTQ